MRFLIVFTFIIITTFSVFGQIIEPVKWTMNQKHVNGDEFELIFKAKIDDGWKVYSQYLESDDGPIRTSFNFEKGNHFELIGKTEESAANRKKVFDEVFKMDLITFKKKGVFTQKVKIKDYTKPITGYLEYMCCDATRCLPPSEVDINFVSAALVGENTVAKSDTIVSNPSTSITPNGEIYQECDTQAVEEGKSLWSIFALGFFGGLLALLTPCVFPMIPLTVSYFTKSGSSKAKGFANAMLYGFFILAVYLLLSVPFHLLDSIDPDILNQISTNVGLNIFFFLKIRLFLESPSI